MSDELYRKKYLKYKAKYKSKVLALESKSKHMCVHGGSSLTIFDFEQYKFPFDYCKILVTNGIMENELFDSVDFVYLHSEQLAVCTNTHIKIFELSGKFVREIFIENSNYYVCTHIIQLTNSNIVVVLRQKDDVEETNDKSLLLLFDNAFQLIKKTSCTNWIRSISQFKNTDGYIGVICTNSTMEIYTPDCTWINSQRISRTKYNSNIFPLSPSVCLFVHGFCSRFSVHLLSNKTHNLTDIPKDPNYKIDIDFAPIDIIKIGDQHFLLLTPEHMKIYNVSDGKLLYTVPEPPFRINYKRCVYAHNNLYVLSDNKILVFETNDNFDSSVGMVSNVLKSVKMYSETTEPVVLDYFVGDSNEKIFNYNGVRASKGWKLIRDTVKGLETNTNINVFDQLYVNKTKLLNFKPLFVFRNIDTNSTDTSLDTGGLSKYAFVELSKYLTDVSICKYFVRDESTHTYDLNVDYFDEVKITPPTHKFNDLKGKIFFLGQLFAYAIIQRLTINIDLNPLLLYQMTHDLDIEKMTVDDVKYLISHYGSRLVSKYPYACFDSNRGRRMTSCIYDKGEKMVANINDIPTINLDKIKEEIEHKFAITKVFVDGFRSQLSIVDTNVKYLNPYMLNIAISGISVVDYQSVMKHLHFEGFDNEDMENVMRDLIKYHADRSLNDSKGNQYMRTFLLAVTGTDVIPVAGYGIHALRIELNEHARVPYDIHTCFNQMKINKGVFDSYVESTDKINTQLFDVFSEITLENVAQLFNIV